MGQPLPYCNIGTLIDQLLDSAMYRERKDQIDTFNRVGSENICCWLVRGSLFIELGCTRDLVKGWRGDLGTFMISRTI